MQQDLDALKLPVKVRIIGVGCIGTASVTEMMEGRSIPWLLDAPGVQAEMMWKANWRDLVILDKKNRALKVYNLRKHSLEERKNYDELLGFLKKAAQ